MHVRVAPNSHFGGLWGHSSLQTASEESKESEVTFDLRFEIINLNYPGMHVHVAPNSHFGGLWGHGGLQMTSEDTSEVRFELSDLNNLCSHASLAYKGFLEMIDTDDDNEPIIIDWRALHARNNNFW